MEYVYTAYSKCINDKEFFFVKRYMIFPEVKNAEKILDGYGMHTHFDKACKIAGINDLEVRAWLYEKVGTVKSQNSALIIPINRMKTKTCQKNGWNSIQRLLFPVYKMKFKF